MKVKFYEKFNESDLVNSRIARRNRTLGRRLHDLKLYLRWEVKVLVFPYYCEICGKHVFTSHFEKHTDLLNSYRNLIVSDIDRREVNKLLESGMNYREIEHFLLTPVQSEVKK